MRPSNFLPWARIPPVLQRQARFFFIASVVCVIAAILLSAFRKPLGLRGSVWTKYLALILGATPLCILTPIILFSTRQIRRSYTQTGGRLCSHCAYDLTNHGTTGTCPECGNTYNLRTETKLWRDAGFAPPPPTPLPDPWPFDQAPNVAAFTLRRIFEDRRPILLVTHDEDDHDWQFLDGGIASVKDAWIIGMGEVVRHDPTVVEVADLPPGWKATRPSIGAPWTRSPNPHDEEEDEREIAN